MGNHLAASILLAMTQGTSVAGLGGRLAQTARIVDLLGGEACARAAKRIGRDA